MQNKYTINISIWIFLPLDKFIFKSMILIMILKKTFLVLLHLVVKICSNVNLTSHKLAYVSSTRVPTFQQTLCKCSITTNTSEVVISFSFVDDMVPQSLSFRVNDNEIKSKEQHAFTTEDRSLTHSVLTHDNYTYEGACLMVSSGMKITSF
jgi:hypothetical protein